MFIVFLYINNHHLLLGHRAFKGKNMQIDVHYNGQQIVWKARRFRATSGMINHQFTFLQSEQDLGPLPEGRYTVFIHDAGVAKRTSSSNCGLVPARGIQKIPAAVGECRIPCTN